MTTLSTSSSWPPIYILITFLGKPSRPHSAWQAAGKTHRALWQRRRDQACWPAEQQPPAWGTSLQGPAWIGFLNPASSRQPPLIHVLLPHPPLPHSHFQPNPQMSNAQLPLPKVSERAAVLLRSHFPRHHYPGPRCRKGQWRVGNPVRPWRCLS